jgi:AcrR family transcriptional regulator
MQESMARRSNADRTQATRAALLAAARDLFVEKGYAETGTPEIVARAKVTRGALYHHFADKAGLLKALVEQEARAVADAIVIDTRGLKTPLEALMRGADAYFAAMQVPGRARLLLLEGPAVLGWQTVDEIDQSTGAAQLLEGLKSAGAGGNSAPLQPLAEILSAAFDKAALRIAEGAPAGPYRRAARALLAGLVRSA